MYLHVYNYIHMNRYTPLYRGPPIFRFHVRWFQGGYMLGGSPKKNKWFVMGGYKLCVTSRLILTLLRGLTNHS